LRVVYPVLYATHAGSFKNVYKQAQTAIPAYTLK
jgi:hypothetical protein